ncbi:hypothetical protein DOY81_005023, partial [Sarcophaga bullata]
VFSENVVHSVSGCGGIGRYESVNTKTKVEE